MSMEPPPEEGENLSVMEATPEEEKPVVESLPEKVNLSAMKSLPEKENFFATESLLRELLVMILNFLQFDDIKLCRLLNRKWDILCNEDLSQFMKKLVFRSPICEIEKNNPFEDVNQFLTYLKDHNNHNDLHVEFIGAKLENIAFRDFGSAIGVLKITNCQVSSEHIVKDMFSYTPNMKQLYFYRYREKNDRDGMLTRVLKALEAEGKFSNCNLERINCQGALRLGINKIFPRLKAFTFDRDKSESFFDFQKVQSYEELHNVDINFDLVTGSVAPPMIQGTKLKYLGAEIAFTPGKDTALEACKAFFSTCSHIEQLILVITLLEESNTDVEQAQTHEIARILFFHIIRTCKMLSIFRLVIQRFSAEDIHPQIVPIACLGPDDCKEICEFTSRLQRWTIFSEIIGDVAVFREIPKLVSLGWWGSSLSKSSDLRLSIIKICSTIRFLNFILEIEEPSESATIMLDLQRILDSQKNLRRLKILFLTSHEILMPFQSLGKCDLRHEKLKEFHLVFENLRPAYCYTSSLTFPNLSSFRLEHPQVQVKFQHLKKQILNWIKEMPKDLKEIKLPHERCCSMSTLDILNICKGKPELWKLEWSSLGYPNKQNMKEVFKVLCPHLRTATVHVYRTKKKEPRVVQYYFSRYKMILYRSVLDDLKKPASFRGIAM